MRDCHPANKPGLLVNLTKRESLIIRQYMEFPIPSPIKLELLPLVSGCMGYNKPPSRVRPHI